MVDSQQFKSEADAASYFKILDMDNRGAIAFGDFMAPLLPQLNTKEKKKLMEKEKISMDDLKQI